MMTMPTITVYKEDAQKRYDDLSAELLGLPAHCKRAKEIRRKQASMELVSPELLKRKIDTMAARLKQPAEGEAQHG